MVVFSKIAMRNTILIATSLSIVYYMAIKRLKRGRISTKFFDEKVYTFAEKEKEKTKNKINRQFFRSAFTQNESSFHKAVEQKLLIIPLISLADCAMKLGIDELKLMFRTRLTKYLYFKYLSGITYYKMSSIDNRISNPDQFLIEDVNKFCNSLCDFSFNICKPFFDTILLIQVISSDIGSWIPTLMIAYVILAGLLLARLRKPISMITIEQQKLEGEFRYVNSRLIANSEEVAFYQGQDTEKTTIFTFFHRLMNHLRISSHFYFALGYIGSIIAKYGSTVCGYNLLSVPFFSNQMNHLTTLDRLKISYKNARMLSLLSESIACLVFSTQELMRLVGYTTHITQFIDVLNDMSEEENKIVEISNTDTQTVSKGKPHLKPQMGKIINQDYLIKFDKVPLVTPNGNVIVKELSFEI